MGRNDDMNCSNLIREIRTGGHYVEQVRDRGQVFFTHVDKRVSAPPPPGPPLERPARPQNFINREEELARLLAEVAPGRVATVCGPGGIGKSALAAEAVWRLARENKPPEMFPDGVVCHDFYAEPQLDGAFAHIALSFGVQLQTTWFEAAQRALSGKRALLVLDGTENTEELSRVLDIRDSCGVIMTSRSRGDATAQPLDLLPLLPDEAVRLLQVWGQEQATDKEAASRISELVGYLPSGVELAGRYLMSTQETARDYLDWLERSPLEALDHGKRRLQSVPVLLRRSLEQISEAARDALAVSGVFAFAPFSREVMLAALPETDIGRALGELVNYGLLMRPERSYQISHQLIHTYVTAHHQPSDAAFRLLADYYIAFAHEHWQDRLEGIAILNRERLHIMRVLSVCGERKDWKAARNLVWAIAEYLDMSGYWIELRTAFEAGLMAARNLNDPGEAARFLGALGTAYWSLGEVEESIEYLEQALAINRDIGHRQGEACELGNLGIAYQHLGKVEEAIGNFRQALAIARDTGYRAGEAKQLGNLGSAYRILGNQEKAIKYLEQSLAIHQDIAFRLGEAADLGNLGNAYSVLGNQEKAIKYLEEALAIDRDIGHRAGEAHQLCNLGSAYSVLGNQEKAIKYLEEALAIDRDIGHRAGEAHELGNLGSAYRILGNQEKAIEYHEEALAIDRDIGDRSGEAHELGNLGSAYRILGQVEKAIEYHEQALAIDRDIAGRSGEAHELGNLGIAYSILGNQVKAIKYLEQALAIHRDIGDRSGEARELGNLGIVYSILGNQVKAIKYLEQALAINRDIGDRSGEAQDLGNLGSAYHAIGRVEKAAAYLRKSITIFEEIKSLHADEVRGMLEQLERA